MKIAFLVQSFPKLSETFILNQIVSLLEFGCHIDIFAINDPRESKVHPDVSKYKLLNRTYYFKIPEDRLQRLIGLLRGYFSFLKRHPFIFLKFKKYVESFGMYFAVNKFLLAVPFLNNNYDIIHCHFGNVAREFLFLKDLLGSKTKFLTVFHGFDVSAVLNQEGINFYHELFEKGDLFLPISNYWKKKLVNLGCASSKIEVHRMGIDLDKFPFVPRKKDSSITKLLTVARLVEKKGLEYSIRAIAKIKNKFPNLEYKIAGDGPLRGKLQELIQKLNLQDTIFLLGPVDQSEVRKLMLDSHIFILPSITTRSGDKEGIPVVLMEAQAMGLPVISTWHSGIPELVRDGKSGFLVPEKNVEALVNRLEYLIQHPEIWPSMGFQGRKMVEENYDLKKLTNRLIHIYKRLLNL